MYGLNQVLHGDCYELMNNLPDKSIDAVISDFPYNTTACDWDKQPIDLPALWQHFKRILKPGGVVVTTASQPFTSIVVCSNPRWFKHNWAWDKKRGVGHLTAKVKPLMQHEDILVFADGKANYYPIMRKGQYRKKGGGSRDGVYGQGKNTVNFTDEYYPTSILTFPNCNQSDKDHETQKPVELYQYLIKTYTNPGDIVLDPFAGSGTTGEAAHNTGRNFILMEREEKYVKVANRRLEKARQQLRFEDMVAV
jgi:site-specific DNA-methyltransferase (adenine-specific)